MGRNSNSEESYETEIRRTDSEGEFNGASDESQNNPKGNFDKLTGGENESDVGRDERFAEEREIEQFPKGGRGCPRG